MKNVIIAIVIFLSQLSLRAQLSEFLMEDNLDDNISSYDGSYIESGVVSSSNPDYIAGPTGKKVSLSPTQGIAYPVSMNQALDTMTSIQFELDINVEDLGSITEPGWKYLLNLSAYDGINGPGINLFIRHDIFDMNPTYDIVFSYADGGFDQGVPDHPGHFETSIGNFSEGEDVSITLILDFENDQWSSLANDVYTNNFFDSAYDIDIVKTAIKTYRPYLGWAKGLESNIAGFPNNSLSTVSFDNFKVYSPKAPGDPNVLITALDAMRHHINGTILTDMQLDGYLTDVIFNYDGNFSAAQTQIFNYINTYEAAYDPVFSDRQIVAISSLSQVAQLLIFLQQKIHDQEFVGGNIANVAGVAFEFSDIFPGPVAPTAPRVNSATVEVYGTYNIIEGARLAADKDDVKRPTGYYAAPGEMVTITLPSSRINDGIIAMVGAHNADLSVNAMTNRFMRINNYFELNAVSTQIANPFGGAIYINFPEGSNLGWMDVVISGAVKSPYYSTRPGRETPLAIWQAELAAANVEWVDMEAEKYMMTLPKSHVLSITDPKTMMDSLESIQDAFQYVAGRPDTRARAEYFLVDSRLPVGAFGTGYPQTIGDNNSPFGPLFETGLYPTVIIKPNFHINTGYDITLHESGHVSLQPNLITEVESVIHTNASYIYNVLYGLDIDIAFKYSSGESLTMDQATMDWMIAQNFRTNASMGCDPTMATFVCDEIRYQHRGHAKYVEMADLFGWSAFHGMNKVFYDEWSATINANTVITDDEVIANASAAAGVNMAPLFHFWGLQPSPALAEQLSSMPESMDILNRLNYYKSIIPANKAAFQPWYDGLKPRKDPVHHPRYDDALANYDSDNYAAAMAGQIDFLIATYFGNNPCVQNLNLSNTIGAAAYTAQHTITASSVMIAPGNASFSASNYIELLEGYEVPIGLSLVIDLNGCVP